MASLVTFFSPEEGILPHEEAESGYCRRLSPRRKSAFEERLVPSFQAGRKPFWQTFPTEEKVPLRENSAF
jgi:hypothetical protein